MASNIIDGNGIQTQTYADILAQLVTDFKNIYGADINVASNTPDGGMLNTLALSKQDILDLLVQIYDSFDPDQAVGVALDGISQLCGITRNGGSYTQIQVIVTATAAVTLNGMDTSEPFTVSDANGNIFYLITSTAILIGDNVCNFQAAEIGFIQVLVNTLTTIVTPTYGAASVNNVDAPYAVGADQETDAQFRVRRQNSVAKPSQGWLQGLLGGLYSVEGLTQAAVYENTSGSTDGDLIPAHSIWVIVDGGAAASVAEQIYLHRSAGCGMTGGESVAVGQTDGSTFTVYFDYAVQQDLYVKFAVEVVGGGSYDAVALKAYIAANYILKIYQPADVSSVVAAIKAYNTILAISSCQVSANGTTWGTIKFPDSKKNVFVLTAANITIL